MTAMGSEPANPTLNKGKIIPVASTLWFSLCPKYNSRVTPRFEGGKFMRSPWLRGSLPLICFLFLPALLASQGQRCGAKELSALLTPQSPAYNAAMDLQRKLTEKQVTVQCVLMSKSENDFKGQKGAAVFRTDHGDFEALFLPETQTFERLKVMETAEAGGRYTYRFQGPPEPWAANLIDSSHKVYFTAHKNVLFVVDANPGLAAFLEKASLHF
jgi:hypothetical protein